MRSSWILVMAFGMGCDIHSDEKSDSATTSTTSSTCWFCTDSGTSTPSTTSSTKTETTKDTGKPTTYYTGTGTTKEYGWLSYPFNTTTGTGDIYYYVEDCALYFEAVSSKPLDDCAECLFAVAINLGDPSVLDGFGCDDDPAMEVNQLRYGHADAGLYVQDEGGVWALVDGSSKMYGAEWYFSYVFN